MTSSPAPASRPRARIHIAVFLVFLATIALVGRSSYTTQRRQFEANLHAQIDQVADLKAKQVAAWRIERLGDAAVAVAGTLLMPAVPQVMRGTAERDVSGPLHEWLEAIRVQYQYENILLIDGDGRIRLSAGELLATPERYAELGAEARGSEGVEFRDLPRDARVVRSHFTLGARLKTGDGSTVGAILLSIDPSVPRYRSLLTWPSESQTGEVVLVRRDGDAALYLSAPRRQPGSAMALRENLSNRTSPIVRAALGQEGPAAGEDSGVRVVASARRVPDSSGWLVVAKLDAEEAYAPLQRSVVRLLEIGGVLVFVCAFGVALIWRYQVSTFDRQRLEAEKERQVLVGHYEFLTRFGNDAILLVEGDGTIVEVNDRTVEWFGYTREALQQMNVHDLRKPDELEGFQRTWDALKVQKNLVFETVGYRKDRTSFPVELSARVMEINGRRYVQAIVRDITERRQAESQIQRLNHLYAVLSACGQAIVQARSEADLFDRVCRIAVEHGGFRMAAVGLFKADARKVVPVAKAGDGAAYLDAVPMSVLSTPDESSATGLQEQRAIIYNDLTGDLRMAFWKAEAERHGLGSSIALPLRQRGSDVGVLALAARETFFFNDAEARLAEEVAANVSFALDSLERDHQRRNAEASLRVSRDRLERVLDAIDEGYWDWNRATGELHLSSRYYTMLGYVPGELQLGWDSWLAMAHPEDAKIVDAEFARFAQTGHNTFSMELRMRCKSGLYIWVLSRGKVVERDASGKPVRLVGTHTDITERKKLEDQFLQAQKLESVGRLAGGIAHDFNNLLTVINGYSEVILGKLAVGDPHRRYVDAIQQAGSRAAGLTEQLLAFSRKQVTQPRVLGLNGVVADSERLLLRLVREDIEMVTALDANADHVMADPSQLHQVVMNLVVNARDAMPAGGRLVIGTANVDATGREAADILPGRYVVLSVADTGTGMDEETRLHVFEPFFTTKERGKGTGLGLSTVYGIVHQSGGFIRLDSEVGKGTTFHIYLPQVRAGLQPTVTSPAHQTTERGSETVLIAEDQALVRELAVDTLRALGYRVLAAADGDEAFRIATEHTGPIHILLTDVVMPGMDGWMLAERLMALRPGLKVVYASGYTDDVVSARRVLDAGASYLAKPFTPTALSAKIREAVGSSGAPAVAASPLKRTVLIVDDDESVRSLFPDFLGAAYNVLLAVDGKEAIDVARRERELDLVLTDLFMPNQDGIETIQVLQELRPALRIIAMSGAFDGEFLTAAERVGVDATLKKPIELDTLRKTIDEVLNRSLRPA